MKRKIVVLVGVALALLIGAAFVASSRQRRTMDREVDAILAAARAAGEPITTQELGSWHRRNIKNGNLAPVVERAVAALPRDTPKVDVERALVPLPASKTPEIALDQPLPERVIEPLNSLSKRTRSFFSTSKALPIQAMPSSTCNGMKDLGCYCRTYPR